MVGKNIFNAVRYYKDDDDGSGHWMYDICLDEAIEFVKKTDDYGNYIETSCLNTNVYEDGQMLFSKERAEEIAKEEWEEYIRENPDSPEALFGVG